MTKIAMKKLIALGFVFASSLAFAAGPGVSLEPSQTNLTDRASLQRGAQLFMNYCMGCHSLGYLRYSRMAQDLGLSEEQVMQNLNFTGAKFGEQMVSAMDPADATAWIGAVAPDLTLVARAKLGGPDWVYTYLKSFYADETRPNGWNNLVLPGSSMPHVLWDMQGIQRAVYAPGEAGKIERLEVAAPGSLSAAQYDHVARDITTFLHYASEPSALQRQSIGVWVILFLAFFTLMAWLLKQEYWRDVH
jgi:ubiquinol-cytochrome c reductase cytochrome c1 subunit